MDHCGRVSRQRFSNAPGGRGPSAAWVPTSRFSRAQELPARWLTTSVANLDIHELPAARGCTYVLPAADYALGLTLAASFGDANMRIAAKLGVTAKKSIS